LMALTISDPDAASWPTSSPSFSGLPDTFRAADEFVFLPDFFAFFGGFFTDFVLTVFSAAFARLFLDDFPGPRTTTNGGATVSLIRPTAAIGIMTTSSPAFNGLAPQPFAPSRKYSPQNPSRLQPPSPR
jgi:hypothetical protein